MTTQPHTPGAPMDPLALSLRYVTVASTNGETVRWHTVPVNAKDLTVIAANRKGNITPPLFARKESAETLLVDIGRGVINGKYVDTKWICAEDAEGGLVLPKEALAAIEADLAAIKLADGTAAPRRLATAEEAVKLVESTSQETRAAASALLAQFGLNAPLRRGIVPAPVAPAIDPGFTARIEAMEAELAQLRTEKAEREEAERFAAEKAALRAILLDELRAELAAEAEVKAAKEKVAAEQAELLTLRAEMAKLKAKAKAANEG